MKICKVKTHSVLASFRIPETQTFHQTLPLPPITTLIGLLGAALGKEYEQAFYFSEQNKILFGVSGTSKGETKDLWNYRKITTKEKNYTAEEIKSRKNYSIVLKEYLYDNVINLFFGHPEEEIIINIQHAFLNPVFPLTAGSSDDLIKVVSSNSFNLEQIGSSIFKNTVLQGDLAGKYSVSQNVFHKPIYESIKSPKTHFLPAKFCFSHGIRKVAERRSFTFVGDEISLNKSIECFQIDGENIELYSI